MACRRTLILQPYLRRTAVQLAWVTSTNLYRLLVGTDTGIARLPVWRWSHLPYLFAPFFSPSNCYFGPWLVMEPMKIRSFSSHLSNATIRPYVHSLSPCRSCIVSCRWRRVQRNVTSDNTNQRLVSDSTTERPTTRAISSQKSQDSTTDTKDVNTTR